VIEATAMARGRPEDRVFDLLTGLGEVTTRPLSGRDGLYHRESIFGILS
jgi:TfoX/Sxy family transcriptional regulator of competence genes